MSEPEQDQGPQGSSALVTRSWVYKSIMWFVVNPIYRIVFRTRITGREHLPPSKGAGDRAGAAMIVANHLSFLDIPLIARGAGPRHVAFIARDTLADTGWLEWVMRRCGTILIQRGKPDRRALRGIVENLEQGDLVGMFPEGARSEDGRLAPFKKGALLAARLAGAPIIPAVVRGTYEAWPRSKRLPRPRRLSLCFLPPIDPSLPDALELTRSAIARELGEESPADSRQDHGSALGVLPSPNR